MALDLHGIILRAGDDNTFICSVPCSIDRLYCNRHCLYQAVKMDLFPNEAAALIYFSNINS